MNWSHISAVAFSPNIEWQGSPGIALAMKNTTRSTPRMTGMAVKMRLTPYWITGYYSLSSFALCRSSSTYVKYAPSARYISRSVKRSLSSCALVNAACAES